MIRYHILKSIGKQIRGVFMAGCGKMKKGGSVKSGAGVAPQVPAQFAAPKVTNGFKKGGAVKHDDAAQDKKLISKMIAASEKKEPVGMKKGGAAMVKPADKNAGKTVMAAKPGIKKKVDKTMAVDDTKGHFDTVKVKHSYASSGAAVKKLPLKLAMGGAAKTRKNFPMTKPMPKGQK